MHGISDTTNELRPTMIRLAMDWLYAHRKWCMIVVFPTLLTAAYLYLFAADQYESEAHFVVRSAQNPQGSGNGLSQAFSFIGAPPSSSQMDAMLVADYLTSHDAVETLSKRVNLISFFRRPEADLFARLWTSHPTPERLVDYYNGQVSVKINSDDGIATLRVRTFRPGDSLAIINQVMALGEERVNQMNRRSYASTVASASQQMADAEESVSDIQKKLTLFRRNQGDVSPQITSQARVAMLTDLQGRLVQAQAQASAMASAIDSNSPQLVAMRQRVAAIAAQVREQQAKVANGPGNLATTVGTFEELKLRQDFAAKRYDAAAAALQKARDDAARQQIFIARLVEPNLPVKALYPKRIKIVLTVLLTLLLTYGIGWLIAAGVREHSA